MTKLQLNILLFLYQHSTLTWKLTVKNVVVKLEYRLRSWMHTLQAPDIWDDGRNPLLSPVFNISKPI